MATVVENKYDQKGALVFDFTKLQKQPDLPIEFTWPEKDLPNPHPEELNAPLIDLEVFLRGDEKAILEAAERVRTACLEHGFFQVINHGVDANLLLAAHEAMDAIFKLPLDKKLAIAQKPGSIPGYSVAHAERFATNLPWKETFTFFYQYDSSEPEVVNYFMSILGQDFEHKAWVYQKLCEAMKKLSGTLFELLAISLGVKDRMHYKKYFEDGHSITRCNYYPLCKNADIALGTGPHCDPVSITILHQDEEVAGLEVFCDNKWQAVLPKPGALVINIGDTFKAFSNGNYKSCLHRAVVNTERDRKSMAFFLCPKDDKLVRPPQDLVDRDGSRRYPDFTWSDLLQYTQKQHRVDEDTLPCFVDWFESSKMSI